MIVIVQVADLSHENFKSSRVMRWWLSRLSSRSGAKSSRERKPKWLPGLFWSTLSTSTSMSLWTYASANQFIRSSDVVVLHIPVCLLLGFCKLNNWSAWLFSYFAKSKRRQLPVTSYMYAHAHRLPMIVLCPSCETCSLNLSCTQATYDSVVSELRDL